MKTYIGYPGIEYMLELAHQASVITRANFSLNMDREWKADETPLTATDTAINDLVLESIGRDYPNVQIIGEEGSRLVRNTRHTVFCDPVDGTIPFSLGLPISTFCISVFEDGKPIIGLISDPFQDRTWFAEKGFGAYVRMRKCIEHPLAGTYYEDIDTLVHVSTTNSIKRSNISMIWWKDSPYHLSEVSMRLMEAGGHWTNHASVGIFGGLIASGTVDGSIFPGQKAWETAAMQVIVEEAGGKVTDIYGNEMRYDERGHIKGHIISNGLIHDQLVDMIAKCQ